MSVLTKKNLPLSEITATTIPARDGNPAINGFKVGGAWLNGSQAFSTAADLYEHLMGKEITYSKNGKSLVIVGDFAPVNEKLLKSIMTAREETNYVPVNLADLL